jgi:hypothetical protein
MVILGLLDVIAGLGAENNAEGGNDKWQMRKK